MVSIEDLKKSIEEAKKLLADIQHAKVEDQRPLPIKFRVGSKVRFGDKEGFIEQIYKREITVKTSEGSTTKQGEELNPALLIKVDDDSFLKLGSEVKLINFID